MNTSKVSYMSSSRLLKGFWSLLKVFMKPEADLQQLEGFIFGRKDVWQPIIYDLYDENYILYNSFRPFLSSSEVQNLQNLQGFCPGLHLASEDFLKIFASLSFFSSSDLHFFSRKNRMTFKTQGSGSFFFLHTFFFSSLCSLAPPCAEFSQFFWKLEHHKEILPTMEIRFRKIPILINRTCPIFRRIWMKWCSMKNMPVLQCHWLAQWQMNSWSSKYPLYF